MITQDRINWYTRRVQAAMTGGEIEDALAELLRELAKDTSDKFRFDDLIRAFRQTL